MLPSVSPAILLIRPQLAENIGAAARVMRNFGLSDLTLVAPKPAWPGNPKAEAMAAGAEGVLAAARVAASIAEGASDIHHLYAMTARPRDMDKRALPVREAAAEWALHARAGERVGILFGPERTGLQNEDIMLAGTCVAIPTDPDFFSLNLAQGVAVAAHCWFEAWQAHVPAPPPSAISEARNEHPPATAAEIQAFFEHLEGALEAADFFKSPTHRATMWRNLRNLFTKSPMTSQDVRTLHGVVRALRGRT